MTYTAEQEATLRKVYTAATSDETRKNAVDTLAEKLNKSRQSIISKLTRMEIYRKPTPKTKAGKEIVSKNQWVNGIKIMLGARDHELESLEKVSKRDLELISQYLVRINNRQEVK